MTRTYRPRGVEPKATGRPINTTTRLGKVLVHYKLTSGEVGARAGIPRITMERLLDGSKVITMREAMLLGPTIVGLVEEKGLAGDVGVKLPARALLED